MSGLDDGARQPVRCVPAVVLGGRQHRAGACGRVDDRAARANRDAERLLADHVQAFVERRDRDRVVDGRIGDDVERLDDAARDQLLVVGVDGRTRAQHLLRETGSLLGGPEPRVADGGELERVRLRPRAAPRRRAGAGAPCRRTRPARSASTVDSIAR